MASRAQPRAEESHKRQMGPKGASLGQAELSSEALDPVGTRRTLLPPSRPEEVLALLWSPAWAGPGVQSRYTWSRSSWLLPLLGDSGFILIKSPPFFCKEAGGLGLES